MEHSGIITIGASKCGIQIGMEIFKQFAAEHNIDKCGNQISNETIICSKFFDEVNTNKWKPRALFIDNDDIYNDEYKELFNECTLSINDLNIDEIMCKLRVLTEKCECIEGFILPYNIAGNLSTNLRYLFLEKLRDQFKKSQIHSFQIYPTKQEILHNSTYLYNSIRSISNGHKYENISLLFDNQKLRQITQKYLSSYLVSLNNFNIINEYISRIISGYTSGIRYNGSLNVNMKEIESNLVPYPSLHYLISSNTPIIPKQDILQKYSLNNNARDLLVNGFSKDIYLNGIPSSINKIIYEKYCNYFEFETESMNTDLLSMSLYTFKSELYPITISNESQYDFNKFMAVSLNYRGPIIPKDVEYVISSLKTKRCIEFVDWCPTGFKVGINYNKMILREENKNDCIMNINDNELTMIGNNLTAMDFIDGRVVRKYEILKKKNKEMEFDEGYQTIKSLYDDYKECLEIDNDENDDVFDEY